MSAAADTKSVESDHLNHKRRKSTDSAALRNVRKDYHEPDPSPHKAHSAHVKVRRDSESYLKEKTAHGHLRRDSDGHQGPSAEAPPYDYYERGPPPQRPRRPSEGSVGGHSHRRRNSSTELANVEDPMAKPNVGSVIINPPATSPTPNPATTVPLPVPVGIVPPTQNKAARPASAPPPPKNGCDKCLAGTKDCLENSRLCPSKTGVFEMFTILVDATAILLLILANIVPWVKSVPPCMDCPQQFTSGAYLAQKGLTVSFGVWTAATMSNSNEYIRIAEYLTYLNTTQSLAWAQQYSDFYFPPGAKMLWTDLGNANVCQPNTPGYMFWGFIYQLCPWGLPSPVMGTQAMLIIACIGASFSMLFMIAARKGSSWWAVTSTCCSMMSFLTALGALLCFSLWGYTRSHFDAGQGTVPLRAVAQTSETSLSGVMVMPVAATFIWDAGYFFAVFAIVCEIFTTIVSWIVGTERWWWAPEVELVYGPDAWMVDTDPNAPINYKPTLSDMRDLESQNQHTVVLS